MQAAAGRITAGGQSASTLKQNSTAEENWRIFATSDKRIARYGEFVEWSKVPAAIACSRETYEEYLYFLVHEYEKDDGDPVRVSSIDKYVKALLHIAIKRFLNSSDIDAAARAFCDDRDGQRDEWLKGAMKNVTRQAAQIAIANGTALEETTTPIYGAHVQQIATAYAAHGSAESLLRKQILLMAWQAAGRSSEVLTSSWDTVTYDALIGGPVFFFVSLHSSAAPPGMPSAGMGPLSRDSSRRGAPLASVEQLKSKNLPQLYVYISQMRMGSAKSNLEEACSVLGPEGKQDRHRISQTYNCLDMVATDKDRATVAAGTGGSEEFVGKTLEKRLVERFCDMFVNAGLMPTMPFKSRSLKLTPNSIAQGLRNLPTAQATQLTEVQASDAIIGELDRPAAIELKERQKMYPASLKAVAVAEKEKKGEAAAGASSSSGSAAQMSAFLAGSKRKAPEPET